MRYPHLKFNEDKILRFLELIAAVAIFVEVAGKLKVVKDDPGDDMIVEAALEYW